MSYCRFSTNNFGCDLYCYEDASGGWTTHVAGTRYVGDIPKLPELTADNHEKFTAAITRRHEFLDTADRVPIGGPCDGQSFYGDTLEEFQDRLLYLRSVGYRFPDYVLEEVAEELAGAAQEVGEGCQW